MDEYINRDKALEEFDAWVESTGVLPKGTSYYAEARGCIECVPAVDVEPVRHGRWIEDGDFVVCPVCGRRWNVFDNDTDTFDRCPHCGAHIDGEVTQDG